RHGAKDRFHVLSLFGPGGAGKEERLGRWTRTPPQRQGEGGVAYGLLQALDERGRAAQGDDEHSVLQVKTLRHVRGFGGRGVLLLTLGVDLRRRQRATPVVTDGVVVAQQTPGLVDPHPHREPDQVGDVLSPGASLGCGQQAEHPRLGGPVAGRTSAVLRTRPPRTARAPPGGAGENPGPGSPGAPVPQPVSDRALYPVEKL